MTPDGRPRRTTPLERIFIDAVADAMEARDDVDSLDLDLDLERIQTAMREVFSDIGDLVSARLLETMRGALEAETEARVGFEARLRKHWARSLDRFDALAMACAEVGDEFAHQERAARQGNVLGEALLRIHARTCLIAREVASLTSRWGSGSIRPRRSSTCFRDGEGDREDHPTDGLGRARLLAGDRVVAGDELVRPEGEAGEGVGIEDELGDGRQGRPDRVREVTRGVDRTERVGGTEEVA